MISLTNTRRHHTVGRLVGAGVTALALLGAGASVVDAGGPPADVLDGNDSTWACGPDEPAAGPLPANHCINVRSKGDTRVIIVLDGDSRWPQESISWNPASDDRPCPHDLGSGDGTWWSVSAYNQGPWVCHHKP